MERNRLDQKLAKKTRKNENAFKDILVNEDNDDVIIPIRATNDEAVLHIGIGKKIGVSIEKSDATKGKENKTSVEHTTKTFLGEHFMEDNKKSQSRKKKHRGGRNNGKRVESAKTREEKTVPETEELFYLSLECDTCSAETDINIPKTKSATSNVVSEIVLQDKAEEYTAETDQINKSMLTDSKAESAVRSLPRESKFQNNDILTNTAAFSSTSSSVFEKLLGTKRPEQSRSLAGTCYTRSLTNMSKKFSEAATVSVAPSQLVPQSIITHPDVVLIVAEMGHFNTTASNISDDSKPNRSGTVTFEEYVRSEIANKSVSPQTIEDKVPKSANLIELSFKNKEPQNGVSHTVQDDFITARNIENEMARTKDQEQATASEVISDHSTEIVHESLYESKYLDQDISQHVVSTAISCKRETAVTTMTRPVDQVVSLLTDKPDNETETEVQRHLKSPGASMEIKEDLKMPEESRLNWLSGMTSEGHSDVISDDVSSIPNTEARSGSETGSENEVDIGCKASERYPTTSSVTRTGSPSGYMATDDTATAENDSSLAMPLKCREVHTGLATEITASSSEFTDERVEAIAGGFTPPFESVPCRSCGLTCEQLNISSETTIPVASASRTSYTSNALPAPAPTQETAGTATQASADTATQASADTATQATADTAAQATADTATQATAHTATQAIADTAIQATAETATQPTADTATQATSDTATQASADTATQATAGTATQATADTAAQATADSATQATAHTATQAIADTAIQATAETATQPTADTATQTTADTATQATADTATFNTADTATQATAGTATQATGDTAAQATADTVTQATADTATLNTADTATQATADTATQATADTATQATADTATQASADTAAQATAGTATQAPPCTTAQATADIATQATAGTATQAASGTATQGTAGTATHSFADTATQATSGTATQATTGIAAQADVSLSDILTNLSSDDKDDGYQDDDAFGIMGIFRKSDLHSPVNTIFNSRTTKKIDFGYIYFSLKNFIKF